MQRNRGGQKWYYIDNQSCIRIKIVNFIYFVLLFYFVFILFSYFELRVMVIMISQTITHLSQSQVMVTQSYITKEYKRFQNNDVILHINSI